MNQIIPDNIILMTDSYKVSHHKFYPQGIQKVSSYLESREGGTTFPYTIFFGLQYYLKRLEGVQVTTEKIDEAEELFKLHFGRDDVFNRAGWEYIRDTHGGKLPVTIRAVPEGLLTPIGTVLMTIENTDPHCAWLVNYLETFLMKVWYPITVATQSHFIRGKILERLEVSGDVTGINFKTHDFGYRGVSSEETACLGGAAHLVSFMGTDTFGGIQLLRKVYGATMPGYSIPATEHSIICSFGGESDELAALTHVLKAYPEGLIACVSDTFNIYRACETFGTTLKELVMGRKGTLVIRPDSGDFFEVLPKCLNILWERFGGTVNDKGFKVLEGHVRLIQGDGMDKDSIPAVYEHLEGLGWSADNLAVGSGGGLLQKMNRDTLRFAFKASAVLVNEEWRDVQKNPITDTFKKSKAGRWSTFKRGAEIVSAPLTMSRPGYEDIMATVFEDGVILKTYDFQEVKRNAGT